MSILTKQWPPILTILLSALGGYLASPYLPARIPVHWGIDGSASTYAGRQFGVYLNPAAMAVAYLFFTLIPYSDKRRVHHLRELGIYEPLRNTAVYVFGLAQLLSLGIGLGFVNASANYILALACLLTALGAEVVRVGLTAPLKAHLRRYAQTSDDAIRRVSRRLQIASVAGMIGALFAPLPTLWFIIPLGLVVGIERFRKSE
jgi:uncharacterized membrane protein